MFIGAWLVLLGGLFGAVIAYNGQDCGAWGLDCLLYAFCIALGSNVVAALLFGRAVAIQTRATAKWYTSAVMTGLTSTASIAGLVVIALIIR